nr:EOG090X0G6M [Eulimnadia texana]
MRKLRTPMRQRNNFLVYSNYRNWELRKSRLVGDLLETLFWRVQSGVFCLRNITLPDDVMLLLEFNLALKLEWIKTEKLLNEEVHLLVSRNFARVAVLFQEERRRQILSHADQITSGKRKKWVSKHGDEKGFDKDLAIQEELDKISTMPKDLMMIHIFTRHPWPMKRNEVDWVKIKCSNRIREAVFVDLWSKGFYLTAGEKFGGDFLAYPGDPVKFHAHYIVVCLERTTKLTPKFLVGKGRLGSNVKKTVLLCSLNDNDDVIYQSLQWSGL